MGLAEDRPIEERWPPEDIQQEVGSAAIEMATPNGGWKGVVVVDTSLILDRRLHITGESNRYHRVEGQLLA